MNKKSDVPFYMTTDRGELLQAVHGLSEKHYAFDVHMMIKYYAR